MILVASAADVDPSTSFLLAAGRFVVEAADEPSIRCFGVLRLALPFSFSATAAARRALAATAFVPGYPLCRFASLV